jgi:Domain of unknown function (DUF4350)
VRHRFVIIVTIALVLGVLIALNAATYVQKPEQADTEFMPNRSTYNAGATGTRAFYDLLSESGYRVMRWRENPTTLLADNGSRVTTFVIVGLTLLPIDNEDAKSLLLWVERGGRLVIIDRTPAAGLLPKSGEWTISARLIESPFVNVDPANWEAMTEGVALARPAQPTLLTREVQAVRPSRFASAIKFSRGAKAQAESTTRGSEHQQNKNQDEDENSEKPAKGFGVGPGASDNSSSTVESPAPVVHLGDSRGALLADYAHGKGRIILLSDPYIVANGGIRLEDNLQLAINTVAATGGLIAFDEFHQGHAATKNAVAAYFAGTPILAIFGQLVLVILVIVWTRGRRFGRPLPLPQVDRRSSLEFVASMAELQQRARALDLAIENIYSRTRRVLTRYAGVDYHSSRSEIAERVATRSSLNREKLESLMRSCEETINGAPISERQTIELVRRLRQVERALGLRMRSRDVKQAAESI